MGYNGTINGYFKRKRGPRQGNPISPYLFVLAMNHLSLLLNKAVDEGKFSYHLKCQEISLSHLCFTDDLLIFLEGSLQYVENVRKILQDFEALSGLAISREKTSFYTSVFSDQEAN